MSSARAGNGRLSRMTRDAASNVATTRPSGLAKAIGAGTAMAATLAYVVDRDATARRAKRAARGGAEFVDLPVDRAGVVSGFDGNALYYEEVGPANAKITVIFVHGYCVDQGFFYFQRKALTEMFAGRARFIFFDLRSHGRSQAVPSESCTIEALGQDLNAIVRARAPKGKLVLIGHSMGGMSIMAYAQQHPEVFTGPRGRVAGLGLISTSTGKLASVTFGLPALLARIKSPIIPMVLRTARTRAALVEQGRRFSSDLTWAMIRRFGFVRPDVDPAVVEYVTSMIAGTRIETIADFYGPLMNNDSLAAVPLFSQIPTAVICGDSDAMTPIDHSKELAEQLPLAKLIEIPRAGHAAVLEVPEPINDALAGLITGALGKPVQAKAPWRARRKVKRQAKREATPVAKLVDAVAVDGVSSKAKRARRSAR